MALQHIIKIKLYNHSVMMTSLQDFCHILSKVVDENTYEDGKYTERGLLNEPSFISQRKLYRIYYVKSS